MLEFGGVNVELGNHFPFLVSLQDEPDNELRIVLAMPFIGEKGAMIDEDMNNKQIKRILEEAYPIIPDTENQYEILFRNYILYQTRNESFISLDTEEISSGSYLLLFEKSKLLNYLETVTDVQRFSDGGYYPGKWVHYGILTGNHVIDIISSESPVIRRIGSEDCTN